ncbi:MULTISPECIES: hypothetical protein [unclassified Acinetobacter]|uniref:hypothetical protein n=1 Tax=unclassified Acinetobacter TaxID=196816 RepID=UPI00244A740C|nr:MULTISPECIES: hypothetical protein [unclassified Acinetobacter]MDH0032531.1 hypothetical protein [Acinetobacter sp. GD04021]MDH0885222.1 hypothetical protein [Acinetobacter sp. GD03873]MDH1084450.1 hypothetical protein [Acinetobacter sp. GD03983]MDH2188338.1 hypothetical protein [Acinetobacter sp. GD03645]MDH2203849.1 hypothetical protein [Acinetobacter sp. GD03647]
MSEEQESEVAIIPAGSYVGIMGCRFILLQDSKVEADQANLDYILKHQKDFYSFDTSYMDSSHQKADDLFQKIDDLLQKQLDQLAKTKIKGNVNREYLMKKLDKLIENLSNKT